MAESPYLTPPQSHDESASSSSTTSTTAPNKILTKFFSLCFSGETTSPRGISDFPKSNSFPSGISFFSERYFDLLFSFQFFVAET